MLFLRNPRLGEKLLRSSLVAFTIISFFVHMKYKFAITIDVMNHLLSEVYMAPWTRISPYLMGTLTAIYLQRNGGSLNVSQVISMLKFRSWRELKIDFLQKMKSRCWLTCWLILFVIMFGQLYKSASVLLASIMKIAAHLEVGFVFCWVIVADNSGFKNGFLKFLSKGFFVRDAKITYAMYLVAPIITKLTYGLMKSGGGFDFPDIVSWRLLAIIDSK